MPLASVAAPTGPLCSLAVGWPLSLGVSTCRRRHRCRCRFIFKVRRPFRLGPGGGRGELREGPRRVLFSGDARRPRLARVLAPLGTARRRGLVRVPRRERGQKGWDVRRAAHGAPVTLKDAREERPLLVALHRERRDLIKRGAPDAEFTRDGNGVKGGSRVGNARKVPRHWF